METGPFFIVYIIKIWIPSPFVADGKGLWMHLSPVLELLRHFT